ncbi:MAG: putative lipid II flippase FtsW [Deltaproteobacteria bacterium]|nr:putative lipid II flippase FtsW [Deltaproteobacteria bacterium]
MTNTLLLLSCLSLLSIGVIMVYSTSSISALKLFDDEYYFLKKELVFAVLGILLLAAVARFPYQYLSKLAYPILALSIGGLLVLLIPGVGVCVGGATRWLRFGPLSIQPAECAKLGLIIYLSYFLYKRAEKIRNFSTGFLPPLLITGGMSLLILQQPDFGTAVLMMMIFFLLMFVGGAKIIHLMTLVTGLVPIGCFLIMSSSYRLKRLTAFLDPWSDPANAGFHIIQSYIAFGSGGVLGQGLGNSRQKLFYLPEAHTDFILSVLGEELGFIGVLLVIVFFLVIILCGIKIALRSRDLLGTYIAVGMVSLVGLQALLNMGVVMGLLPTKGSTLPFISYGGTSLLVNCAAMGILLSVSTQSRIDER